jgi:plasmid stability protein
MWEEAMATMTLRNVPDALYARLKERARANRRSLNQEALTCLEASLADSQVADLRANLIALRKSMAERGVWVKPDDVERYIREGRK